MKLAKIFFLLNCLTVVTVSVTAQQRFADFESGVPSYFSTTGSTTLTTSSDHVKAGKKALKWSAANGNKITATNLNIPSSELGVYDPNSAQLFVYSEEASDDQIVVEFLDNNNVVQRTGTMLLNFKGWRDYHRSFRYDYNLNHSSIPFSLNQCRITYKQAPGGSGVKNLFFDNFTFIGNNEARLPGPHMALDYELFRQDVGEDPLGAYLKKKNITVGTASPAELSGLQTVKTNYARTIGGVSTVAVTVAKTYVNNCGISRNTDGSIKGRGLIASNNRDTLVLIATHIQSLARASIKNGDTDAKAKLLLFTEYIIDQGVSEGGRNDFAQSAYSEIRTFNIGFLEALSVYPEPLRTDVIKLLKWSHEYNKIYNPNFIPGQNTDFLHVKLAFLFETACSLTSADEAVNDLKYLKNFLENYSLTSEGERDGIKPDGTGFHHKSHQLSYMYAYGTWSDLAFKLKGTIFKVSKTTYDNIVFTYKSMFSESSKGTLFSNSESGRTPFQNSFPVNASKVEQMIAVGGDIIGASFDPDLAAFYNYTFKVNKYATPAIDYDGFYAYNYANLGVKKNGNWTAVIKGLSTELFGAEIYADRNRYGRYQGYGALEILYNGTLEDSGYILNGKGWNWNYMPGTTSVVLPFPDLQAKAGRADEYQLTDFAGALSMGKNGIFGIDFKQRDVPANYATNGLEFKKSVFAFDDLLICLGSNISVTNNQGSVVSTLFQTVSTTATPTMYVDSTTPKTGTFTSTYAFNTDYKWLMSSQGTGFYLPATGNDNYRIELGTQTTPDYQSTDGSITNTANFTRAYLAHGNQPTTSASAKYEYVIAPNTTPVAMKALAQTLSTGSVYSVLKQNGDFHAIKYYPDNSTAYVFFKPVTAVNVGLLKSVTTPSIINIKEYDTDKVLVTINSPDLNITPNSNSGWIANLVNINLGLNGDYTVVSNPNNASVNQQSGILTVGFMVKDGFASTILLKKNNVTPIKSLEFKGSYTPSGIQLNWTSTEEVNVKDFALYRSVDGINFHQITIVNAKGGASSKTSYSYNDNSFAKTNETVYYKLQSIDADGTISSEKIDAVKLPFANTQILYYPNPVANVLNISFPAKADAEIAIHVFSLDGKTVLKQKNLVKKDSNQIAISLVNLNTGEYIIKLSGGEINSTQKFIKL